MSIYYEIKEHLVVRDRTDEVAAKYDEDVRNIVIENLHGRMAVLGSLMLLDEARIYEVTLTADGAKFSFSGDAPSEELKKAISSMENARDIDLVFEYSLYHRPLSELCEMVMPFPLIDVFRDLSEKDMEGLFYTLWNKADCAEGEGILSAYGEKNGKYYSGQVDYSEVSSLPDGTWTADTDACISIEGQPETEVLEKALSMVQGLKEFADVSEYKAESDYMEFILNDVCLKGPEDIRKLLQAYRELKTLPCVDCQLIGEYVDYTGADVRRMSIAYNDNGEPEVFLAEV